MTPQAVTRSEPGWQMNVFDDYLVVTLRIALSAAFVNARDDVFRRSRPAEHTLRQGTRPARTDSETAPG